MLRLQSECWLPASSLSRWLARQQSLQQTDPLLLLTISVPNFVSKLQGSDCMQWFKSVPPKVCVRNLIPITTLLKVRLSERFSGHEDSSLVDRLMLNINGLAA